MDANGACNDCGSPQRHMTERNQHVIIITQELRYEFHKLVMLISKSQYFEILPNWQQNR